MTIEPHDKYITVEMSQNEFISIISMVGVYDEFCKQGFTQIVCDRVGNSVGNMVKSYYRDSNLGSCFLSENESFDLHIVYDTLKDNVCIEFSPVGYREAFIAKKIAEDSNRSFSDLFPDVAYSNVSDVLKSLGDDFSDLLKGLISNILASKPFFDEHCTDENGDDYVTVCNNLAIELSNTVVDDFLTKVKVDLDDKFLMNIEFEKLSMSILIGVLMSNYCPYFIDGMFRDSGFYNDESRDLDDAWDIVNAHIDYYYNSIQMFVRARFDFLTKKDPTLLCKSESDSKSDKSVLDAFCYAVKNLDDAVSASKFINNGCIFKKKGVYYISSDKDVRILTEFGTYKKGIIRGDDDLICFISKGELCHR